MARVLKHLLAIALAASQVLGAEAGRAPRFYPDDPLSSFPDLVSVETAAPRKINALVDFALQSAKPHRRPPSPSEAINTLGEVPDSTWFTNRHAKRRMTLNELRRGPGNSNAPVAPFQMIDGKTEGITPGFTLRDARGRVYFVKSDPESNPELSTAADVIGSKFFYALGYFTPENYILTFAPSDVTIDPEAEVKGLNGEPRRLTKKDLAIILDKIPRNRERRLRVVASMAIPGKPLGPFKYSGTRSDDPNDVYPHERRRDLRGLHVLAAWLNHTDAKAGNSLDVLVRANGRGFLRHYLIDFGAMLGSDSDMPKDARFGHEFIVPSGKEALRRMAGLGMAGPSWESIDYPEIKAVGRFSADLFDPETWKSNYPNPAFLSRQPGDEYWAAKLVMAFTDDEIRAIVATGEYSDPAAVDVISRILIQRRDTIGRVYFNKVLALDRFRVEGRELRFDDLAARHKFVAPRTFEYAWHRFDNESRQAFPVAGASATIPAVPGDYAMVRIHASGEAQKSVSVYLRKRAGRLEVVGVERNLSDGALAQ